jgi:uncharacterized membrane protein
MVSFASSKLLAGIGSILLLIPGLNIVGIILILLGMKDLAEHYKDGRIYRNVLMGTIFGIIGLISMSISMISFVLFAFFPSILTGNSGSTGVTTISYTPMTLTLFITFVFISMMTLFFRKAFYVLSVRSGVRLFRAAGILLLIGAVLPVLCVSLAFVLSIISRITLIAFETSTLLMNTATLLLVLGFVGLILVYITFILLITAFFHSNRYAQMCQSVLMLQNTGLNAAENCSVVGQCCSVNHNLKRVLNPEFYVFL